jgi:UDP-glucose 4-epimerase
MKKILITGGAGFIGSHLINYLINKGNKIFAIDNFSLGKLEYESPYLNNPRFTFIELDLLDKEKLFRLIPDDIDTVFHLASNSDISLGVSDTSIDFKNTTLATFNLLEVMRTKNIKKFFYTSGSGVYGDTKGNFASENYGPLCPISMYGATKLSAEAMIFAYSHLFDMQVFILRPANIIGPRSTHGVIFDFIKRLRAEPEHLIILGDGKQSKSYLYITDVLDAIDLVWNNAKDRVNIYNIASNSFITVTGIAKEILKQMNLFNKTKISYTGGKVGWKGDVPIVRINSNKIKKLGWRNKYSTKQAVYKTVKGLLQ